MPELTVLIPTRGRPGNIRKVISAWDFTNAWDDADMVLIADADDPEIQGYRDLVALTAHPDTKEPLVRLVEMATWMPMVHKLNAVAKDFAEGWPGSDGPPFALGFAGDDHLPQTIGWAKRYVTVLHELGTGMVYGDDGYQGVKLSTEWAVTSDVVRALGRMVPADVEHMYCDNSMMDLFGGAGAMRHLPEIRIEHMHPVAGKAASDEQYARVNGRDQFAKDRRAYEGWRTMTRAGHMAAVRDLRKDRAEVALPRTVKKAVDRKRGTMARMPFPHYFKQVTGATPDEIALALADFARQVPADQEIVEIGVYQGRTALIMSWGARQGNGAHLTGIDPWDLPGNTYDPPFTENSSRRWAAYHVQNLGYANHIRLRQGFSLDYAMVWDGGPIGMIFIDGDHSEGGARADVLAWAPHLADGATIAVDDYGHPDWPGVALAVDKLVDEGVLEPLKIYHDRLAVTRLVAAPEQRAITSDGVSPSPEPAEPDDLLARIEEPAEADMSVSIDPMVVMEGELEGIAAGLTVSLLSTSQLRALAKVRKIRVSTRDGRGDILAAIGGTR